VLLRYTACTGLINQQYSHIAAFSLAAVLGAEIVLPPAAKRDSFAHYFSVFKVGGGASGMFRRAVGMRAAASQGLYIGMQAHLRLAGAATVVPMPGSPTPSP